MARRAPAAPAPAQLLHYCWVVLVMVCLRYLSLYLGVRISSLEAETCRGTDDVVDGAVIAQQSFALLLLHCFIAAVLYVWFALVWGALEIDS
mgnify:CR=1 FL=1